MDFAVTDPAPGAGPSGAPAGKLRLSIIGRVRMSVGACPLVLSSRRAPAILAYVALAPGATVPREELCGLFWPNAAPAKAQTSLRQIVRQLGVALQACGYRGLRPGRLSLGLAPGSVSVDVLNVLAKARDGVVHPGLLSNPASAELVLNGFDDLSPPFGRWLAAFRHSLRARLLDDLQAALNQPENPAAARLRLAQAMVNLDPAHEPAVRALMQVRAESGDTAGALRAYEALCAALLQEHGATPAETTVALWNAVRQGQLAPASPDGRAADALAALRQLRVSAHGAAPEEPERVTGRLGIVVRRFETCLKTAEQGDLVHGFRRELIAHLVRFREWRIFDGEHVAAAGRGGYLLDASAYADGANLVVVLTLQAGDTGAFAWSHRTRLALADWHHRQEQAASHVAASLMAQVAQERVQHLRAGADAPSEAADHWLLGQALMRPHDPATWNEALGHFEAAIRAAPAFAPAYSSIVYMNNVVHVVHPGLMRDPAKLAVALQTARHAVALDGRDARAVLALGWALANHHRVAEADAQIRRALELNGNDFWNLISAALHFAFLGEAARARELLAKVLGLAASLSPAHWGRVAIVRWCVGDLEGAVAALDHVPTSVVAMLVWRVAALSELGRTEQAVAEAQRLRTSAAARWFGAEAPSDAAIGAWALQLHVISFRPIWERLRRALAAAGLPDGGMRFEDI